MAQPNGTMTPKKIAIMTSGGDSPGMNGVVRACVRMAIHRGCDAYCIYEGYEGLVRGGDLIRKTEWYDVRGWLSEGGTLIGTARCMAFYQRSGRLTAAKNMVLNGIDALIICGGDGSLTGADKFRAEWPSLVEELVATGQLSQDQVAPYKHLNIVGLVGSIDNDLSGTDATIGCYSALQRICNAVDLIEATASSHSRAFVVEVMGRHCGWLALMAGVATGADFIFIPEKPREDNWREEMCSIVMRVSRPFILREQPVGFANDRYSTAMKARGKPLSLLPRVPSTGTATRSRPKWSRTFLLARMGSLSILASPRSVTSNAEARPLPTIECSRRCKAWKRFKRSWKPPRRRKPRSLRWWRTRLCENRS